MRYFKQEVRKNFEKLNGYELEEPLIQTHLTHFIPKRC